MRIFLSDKQRSNYFNLLKRVANTPWKKIAKTLQVNERVLRDWRTGKFSLPQRIYESIKKIYSVQSDGTMQLKKLYWHVKEAGKKGGYMHERLYGNPGTTKGRRKGGFNSIKTHMIKKTGFKLLKKIVVPIRSNELAEAIGILIGDGAITKYQVKVTLSLYTDREYALYVKQLFETLFQTSSTLLAVKAHSTIDILISSKALVNLLMNFGLPLGNKVKQEIDIPQWIKDNRSLAKSCLRGVFDTDGSVYIDPHNGTKRQYKSINIAFTNASLKLLNSIYTILINQGFHPTTTSRRSIRLRRKSDIIKYFRIIGSSNPKHIKRYMGFTI